MNLSVANVPQESVVAAHVVVVDRLIPQSGRTFKQCLLRLSGFSQFVETKTCMEKSGRAVGRDTTKSATHPQCPEPTPFAHQIVQSQLEHFWPILKEIGDGVELSIGF